MPGRMKQWLKLAPLVGLLHVGSAAANNEAAAQSAQRVVSLDYCSDQFTLKLIEPGRIAAVSMDATRDFSYMREAATGHNRVRPSAEQVLALSPDLIIRSYGGGPNATQFYQRLGLPVVQIAYTSTINEVKAEVERVATVLGQQTRGQDIVADMNRRLARIKPKADKPAILYVTPGGITSGPGSLVHDIIEAAGLRNFQTLPGWRSLPLEQLTLHQPELLATAFYNNKTNHANYWSAARHPVIRNQLATARTIPLEGATTACGGWFLVDAVEQLARGAVL